MAKIFKKSSNLEEDYTYHRSKGKKFLLFSSLGAIGFVLGLILFFGSNGIVTLLYAITGGLAPIYLAIMLFSFLGVIIAALSVMYTMTFLIIGIYHFNRAHIYGKGIEGENATAGIIAALPQGFYGFQNVVASYEGKTSELDMVVVGPTGIFVIETKNRNGMIRGDYSDREWTQHKIGRRGTPYSNNFYSPVKQVGTHVYRLAHYLRDRGARVHINGAVYFSNPEADVAVSGNMENIPVFSASFGGQNALLRYIISGTGALDEETIRKVCQLLAR